jgi:hypothetical protein
MRSGACTQGGVRGDSLQDWAWADKATCPRCVCGGAEAPCKSPTPSPTAHLRLPDPALGSQLLSQGYGPKKHSCNLLGTAKWALL